MADTNVDKKSPAWRRLASFRANFVGECNKIAYKLYPKLPKSRYAWENLTASQKRRVFGKYKKLKKKTGNDKGKKLIDTNPVNLKNFSKTETLLKKIEKMPQHLLSEIKQRRKSKKETRELPEPTSDKPRLLSINGQIIFPITCKKCEKTSERRISLSESHMSVDSNQIAVVFALDAGRCEECGELYQVGFIR